MAAKKTTAKKVTRKGGNDTVATLPAGKVTKKPAVESLPKGQLRAKDGTIILKAGEHRGLTKATYIVHGVKLDLDGDVFIADYDVNWLPVKKCVCKAERPAPMSISKLASGHFVARGKCENKKCNYHNLTYVWVMERDRFSV